LRLKQLHNVFYGETIKRDTFLHILCFLHFADNSHGPDKGEEYDHLWKLRTFFDKLNEASELIAVDDATVTFKGWVIFRQYIPKKRKCLGIKIYKLCDESGYTYDMRSTWVDSLSTTDNMTATHATVRHLICRVEGLGHKIVTDNYFSSLRILYVLDRHKINSCRIVWPNRKDMLCDFGPKQLKLKRGDIRVRNRGGITALDWKNR